MNSRKLVELRKQQIIELAAKYGARNIRLFGSVARGVAHEASDVDFVVELEPGRWLLDQVGLQQALEELLDKRVDVVVAGGLSPYLDARILAEAVPL